MTEYSIRYGYPTVDKIMTYLENRYKTNQLSEGEKKLLQRYVKCFNFLRSNPRHNSLKTHEINTLSKKFGIKIFESYLANNSPAAGRVFWRYGPNNKEITICGIEPHPEKHEYSKVRLDISPDDPNKSD